MAAMAKPAEKWAATFPKVVMTNQDEKEVNLYEELKGKTVIINFMYTTCDGNCGVAMRALIQLQKALGDRVGREVFIYSITLDPKTDTPKVLKKYAEEYGVKPGPGWTFLTGKPEAIEILRKKFGVAPISAEMRRKLNLKEVDAAEADRKQHAAVLIIGNEAFNRWRTAPILYRPDQILQIIERMKPPQPTPKP
jgi:protein SCO1/2